MTKRHQSDVDERIRHEPRQTLRFDVSTTTHYQSNMNLRPSVSNESRLVDEVVEGDYVPFLSQFHIRLF